MFYRLFHQFYKDDPTENVDKNVILKPLWSQPDIVSETLRNIDLDNLSPNQMEALQKAPSKEQYENPEGVHEKVKK